jgi:peptidoglycan hydrolase-like protein with peptidoglycan-binding domain
MGDVKIRANHAVGGRKAKPRTVGRSVDRTVAYSLQRAAGNSAVRSLVEERTAAGLSLAPLRAAANSAATQALLVARAPAGPLVVQRAPGPLTPAQQTAAVAFNRSHYDVNSVRVIQVVVATTVDGKFGPISAQAVATFQTAQGIPATGEVDQRTLDAVVARCVATGKHDFGIYAVANFFAIPQLDTLSIRFLSTLATASASTIEPGRLRVVQLGPTAMAGSVKIRDSINVELAKPNPAVVPAALATDLLKPAQEKAAIAFNRQKFRDSRSIQAIQGAVGGSPDGLLTGDTVERIAAFQQSKGLTADGKVGRLTHAQLVTEMNTKGAQNGAIRTILDFYRLDQNGLVMIAFDTTDPNNATTTDHAIPGNSIITISPNAFAQGYAGLVHTVAHEMEHVRQNRVGIADIPISEFLGERVEILSRGMDQEDVAGFMNDADRALVNWNLMPAAQRRANFAKFVEVRNKVRARLAKATPAEKATHAATLASYNAVTKP